MVSTHEFNFSGGDILRKITAWWFVSYKYYNIINPEHKNWNCKITDNSLNSRKSRFNTSESYHELWLNEVLNMNYLDARKNSGNLNSQEIKRMAKEILVYLNKISN